MEGRGQPLTVEQDEEGQRDDVANDDDRAHRSGSERNRALLLRSVLPKDRNNHLSRSLIMIHSTLDHLLFYRFVAFGSSDEEVSTFFAAG